jgi:outer membrane biosynthesis protein TonB
MRVLKLKQTTQDGRTKVWRVDSKTSLRTFGASRKADIVSIDPESQKFQSALEHRVDGWHYISFDLKDSNPDLKVTKETTIHLNQSTLQFEIVEKEESLTADFENLKNQGSEVKQIYLVVRNSRVLESHVGEKGQPFYYSIHGKKNKFNIVATNEWTEQDSEGFTIKSKLITVESIKHLSQIPKNQVLDEQSKKTLIITLGVTSLFVFLSFLTPKKESVVAELALPKTAMNVVVKTEKRKPAEQVAVKPTTAQQPKQAPKPQVEKPEKVAANSSAGGSRVTAMLKGAVGARISQLIGKVSATDARSANVLVTASGVKAGEGDSGRSMAAVGKVEASGRNWNGESAGKGSGVSTAGVGGGKGTKSLGGGLGQGKTGSGGVGLIEEESEVTGGLDREVIAQYIKTQLGQILYCYERQLSASPELYGKVAVKFTISGTGKVETQAINNTTLKNTSVEGCILNRIAQWKFPEPKGGTKVLVTYPFLFKSTN